MFNKHFAVEPTGSPVFVPVSKASVLDDIFCIKASRKTDKTGIFSFKGKNFQVCKNGKPFPLEKKEITVMINPRTGMRVQYQNTVYPVKRYEPTEKPVHPKVCKAIEDKRAEAVFPHLKHGNEAWKAIWWFEDYNETLRFLYELFFAKQQASRT